MKAKNGTQNFKFIQIAYLPSVPMDTASALIREKQKAENDSISRFQELLRTLGLNLPDLAAEAVRDIEWRQNMKTLGIPMTKYNRTAMMKELGIEFYFPYSNDVLRRIVVAKRFHEINKQTYH